MQKILIQLDTDAQPSVFDAVVAIDGGAEHLLRYGSVTPEVVRDLVYGAIFTRGPRELKHTAIFIGGAKVAAGEALLKAVRQVFFGPMRVSVMLDSNGANTTAAAAVLLAQRHFKKEQQPLEAAVLGGTGPVGQRVAQLLLHAGANVRVISRDLGRAQSVCEQLQGQDSGQATAYALAAQGPSHESLADVKLIIAAGAPGVSLLSETARKQAQQLKVAIDLNAVPPLGIAGLEVTDRAVERDGVFCYGAIGVGGTKMKIHLAAIERLFQTNDLVLDALEIYELGKSLLG